MVDDFQATTQFSTVLLFFFGAIGFGVISLFMNQLTGGRFPSTSKLSTYECGNDPHSDADIPFNFRFAVIAVIFLLFEIELVFFLPWAVSFRNLLFTTGWPAFFEMITFFFILILAFVYVWRKGGLEWDRN